MRSRFILGRLVDLLPTLDEIEVSEVAQLLLHVAFHLKVFEQPPRGSALARVLAT